MQGQTVYVLVDTANLGKPRVVGTYLTVESALKDFRANLSQFPGGDLWIRASEQDLVQTGKTGAGFILAATKLQP